MAFAPMSAESCDLREVTFRELLERYGTGQDISVVYEMGAGFSPTSRDWVGLYKAGASSPNQYLAFEWAPSKPPSPENRDTRLRKVTFLARYIHVGGSNTQYYQFLYVGGQGKVRGVSTRFLIYDDPRQRTPTADLNQEFDFPEETEESETSKLPQQTESLEDYELIGYASDTDPNSMRGNSGEFLLSEPAQIIHDRISLSGSFEKMAAKLDILKILDVLDLDRNEPMKADKPLDDVTDADQGAQEGAEVKQLIEPVKAEPTPKTQCIPLVNEADADQGFEQGADTAVKQIIEPMMSQSAPKTQEKTWAEAVKQDGRHSDKQTFLSTKVDEVVSKPDQDVSNSLKETSTAKDGGCCFENEETRPKVIGTEKELGKVIEGNRKPADFKDVNNNVERSLVPYRGSGSLAPVYSAFWQSHVIHERLKSLPVPFVVPTARGGLKMRCQSCHRRKQEVRQLQEKAGTSACKYGQLRREFNGLQLALDTKSSLLQKLADQVKYLTQENTSLNISNHRLTDSSSKMAAMGRQNQRLAFEMKLCECKSERLEAENRALHLRKDTLLGELETQERTSEGLSKEKESLQKDLMSLRQQYMELERHLDDVMYSLSLQGYTSMIDTVGTAIDLTKVSGNLVDLEGWNITASKKTEKCLQRLKAQETQKRQLQETVEKLVEENGGLIRDLQDRDATINELGQRIEGLTDMTSTLRSEMSWLESKLKVAEQQTQDSTEELLREKKNTSVLLRKHQEKVNELELRISSLQNCVESTKLTSSTQRRKKTTATTTNYMKNISVQTSSGQLTPCPTGATTPPNTPTGARPKHPHRYNSPSPATETKVKRRYSNKTKPTSPLQETKYGILRSESQQQRGQSPSVTFDKVNEVIPVYSAGRLGVNSPDLTLNRVNEVKPHSPWLLDQADTSSSLASDRGTLERGTAQTAADKEPSTKKKPSRRFVFEYFTRGKKHGKEKKQTSGTYPGKVVQMNEVSCCQCGKVFLPGTDPNYIQMHIDSHTAM